MAKAAAKAYLTLYNVGQALGWAYLLAGLVARVASDGVRTNVWDILGVPAIWIQGAAFLEVVHAGTGLVPTGAATAAMQCVPYLLKK